MPNVTKITGEAPVVGLRVDLTMQEADHLVTLLGKVETHSLNRMGLESRMNSQLYEEIRKGGGICRGSTKQILRLETRP